MKVLEILSIIWLSICTLCLFIIHIKSHKFLKSIALNSILSFAVVLIINLSKVLTGVSVPINWWTVTGSAAFGLPFVCGVILLQIII